VNARDFPGSLELGVAGRGREAGTGPAALSGDAREGLHVEQTGGSEHDPDTHMRAIARLERVTLGICPRDR
jgi:hypothetical protein